MAFVGLERFRGACRRPQPTKLAPIILLELVHPVTQQCPAVAVLAAGKHPAPSRPKPASVAHLTAPLPRSCQLSLHFPSHIIILSSSSAKISCRFIIL